MVLGFDGESVKDYFWQGLHSRLSKQNVPAQGDVLRAGMSAVNADTGYAGDGVKICSL